MNLAQLKTPLPPLAQAVLDEAEDTVKLLLIQAKERNTEIWPAVIYPCDGEMVKILLPMPSKAEKSLPFTATHIVANRFGAAGYFTEAWMQRFDEKKSPAVFKAATEDPASAVVLPPRLQPDNQDVVMFRVVIGDGSRQLGFFAEIHGKGSERTVAPFQLHFDSADSTRSFRPMDFD
jgi:hypothetical protein